MKNKNDVIEVGNQLYKEKNPGSTKEPPSFVYEIVEKWKDQWIQSGSNLNLYEWIHENKK